MDTAMSHFTIDDHLRRYKKALVHLTKCAPTKTFEDVVVYVRKHELFREAMQLYKQDREQHDVIPALGDLMIGSSRTLCRLSC
jgi:hypothetical protein